MVDASLVVDALTQRGLRDVRQRLATRWLFAPVLLDYEVLNAVRGLVLGGRLSEARGADALTATPVVDVAAGRRQVFTAAVDLHVE